MSANRFHDDPALHAALYLLGCLAAKEVSDYEDHFAGCASCRAEVSGLREASAGLARLAPEAEPPAELRGRLLDRVAQLAQDAAPAPAAAPPARPAQSWKDWPASPTDRPVFVAAGDAGWLPIGVAGVTVKGLFNDPAHDRVTMLVRMEPGATYPQHRHGGPEECFLLEGDLDDGEVCMRPGDYLRKDGGSLHGVQTTEHGCLMLIISSLHDELVAPAPDR